MPRSSPRIIAAFSPTVIATEYVLLAILAGQIERSSVSWDVDQRRDGPQPTKAPLTSQLQILRSVDIQARVHDTAFGLGLHRARRHRVPRRSNL